MISGGAEEFVRGLLYPYQAAHASAGGCAAASAGDGIRQDRRMVRGDRCLAPAPGLRLWAVSCGTAALTYWDVCGMSPAVLVVVAPFSLLTQPIGDRTSRTPVHVGIGVMLTALLLHLCVLSLDIASYCGVKVLKIVEAPVAARNGEKVP